ncbi:MAG TPA: FAD-dependent monooxygenase [Burkholderiales bacterium]|nr:FAD-dependent monooxygenase [Burkholderiales bacterium]
MAAPAVDVVVRGAGPVGCTAALALRRAGLSVALFDPRPSLPAFRPLALSHASRLILERLGVWQGLAVTPIERIIVSRAGSFGRTRLEAADAGVPALGYQTEYAALVGALRAALRDALTAQEPGAKCIVHAEGTPGEESGKRYPHEVLVALLETDPPAHSTAYERFTPAGPLALLPLAGRYALIWSQEAARAQRLAQGPEDEFIAALARVAPSSAGRVVSVQARSVQVPTLKVRRVRAAGNEVYIGNAAQTLHPVAGQGLNLGLRDAWDLARALGEAPDPGDAALLARYAASRRLDARAAIGVTDFLAGGFAASNALMSAALMTLDFFPPARRFFARRMIFGASALP